MSSSRFRFTRIEESFDEEALLNLCPSSALFDASNVIACNDAYIAIPWHHSNGVAIFAQGASGKVDLSTVPLLIGNAGGITNVAFDRFQQNCLCSSHEDGVITVWRIPENIQHDTSELHKPVHVLRGHHKRCNVLSFHPSANAVCASAGLDGMVNIWDVEVGSIGCVIRQEDMFAYPTGIEWNRDGSLMCVSSRERQLLLFDPRCASTQASVISTTHTANRQLRCIYATQENNIVTCSVDEFHCRNLEVWDDRALREPLSSLSLDQSSASMLPCYDNDLNLLYLATRGEAGFTCYSLQHGKLHVSYEYAGNQLVKGMCAAPKWMLNIGENEYNRLYQLTANSLITLHVKLPQRHEADNKNCNTETGSTSVHVNSEVHAELYPYTNINKAAMTSEMYFAHTNSNPIRGDLRGLLESSLEDKKIIIVHDHNERETNDLHFITSTDEHKSINNNNNNNNNENISSRAKTESEELEIEECEETQQSTNDVNQASTVQDINAKQQQQQHLRKKVKTQDDQTLTRHATHVDPSSSNMMLVTAHKHDRKLIGRSSNTNDIDVDKNEDSVNTNNISDDNIINKLLSELHQAQNELTEMRKAIVCKEEQIDELIHSLIQLTEIQH